MESYDGICIKRSSKIALEAGKELVHFVSSCSVDTVQELLQAVQDRARSFCSKDPIQIIPVNVYRRGLKIIREESNRCLKGDADIHSSLQTELFTAVNVKVDYSGLSLLNVKSQVLTNINEYVADLETSTESLASYSQDHIHSNEIILTLGYSHSVLMFLKSAAKKREFQVLVAECGPLFSGRKMADELKAMSNNVKCTLIPDAEIFAVMERVNKCIIGTQTVFADGGLRAATGTHGLLLAARRFAVPVLVCCGLYKLAPAYHNIEAANCYLNPGLILPQHFSMIEVHCPAYDLVPPGLVTLFITNSGGHSPSYLYRLISDQYHAEDFHLTPQPSSRGYCIHFFVSVAEE